ncbi:MAG: virginiamycin B lyase family protein [Terriglobia bacterium]
MSKTGRYVLAAGFVAAALVWLAASSRIFSVQAAEPDVALLSGTGMVSGTVEAPKPFQAAKVYVMNTDKNILYMVYTNGGKFRAINLLPGQYEVTVRKQGFTSDPRKIALKAGSHETVSLALRESATASEYPPGRQREQVRLVSYNELYPAGPGKEVLERTCIVCHGSNFLPGRQWNEQQWNSALDLMTSKDPLRGTMITPDLMSQAERQTVVSYLVKNFGPDNTPRGLKLDAAFPVDEAALANAMYVEYYLPLDPTLDKDNRQRRTQEMSFDKDGNVWYTDRSIPNRVGRVNPRTGEIKDYVLPDPKADPHGITTTPDGHVWWAETAGFSLGRIDPRTGEMTRYAMDSSGQAKGRGNTPDADSKGNVYYTAIAGSLIGKWDVKTGKTKVWPTPTADAGAYGMSVDRNDKVWFAEYRKCKVAMFDPATEKFTEYNSPSAPCTIRRPGIDGSGNVWYGVYSKGMLGKIDPKTGKVSEWKLPMPNASPYDAVGDPSGNIWVSDGGQGGTMIKFDPRTEKFTYYPTPQLTDMPKIRITEEGNVWFAPRRGNRAAASVLIPDMTKITKLTAVEF